MGFDSVAVAIMLSAVIIAVGYILIMGNTALTEQTIEGYKAITHSTVKRLQSNVKIISVSYQNGNIYAYIKNIGSTKFSEFSSFDAIVYGKSEGGEFISEYLRAEFEIVKEHINPGIFDPQEIAITTANFPLPNGNYTLLICTPNAICDSFEFSVGGG
uniref:Flagellar protein G n=1 Tax=Archaeoglobus fulgidus TaxID=2234 RepID=A0A7J2TIG4_ARCFL